VAGGVLTIRRDIPPHVGELALPGGFIELEESWEEAAVRELQEETGLEVAYEEVGTFDVHSAPDGTVLIFGHASRLEREALEEVELSSEASELVVVEELRELAFPLHTRVLSDWFD
jgi:ADP-ribose pyrophosphatase YjhB (NUDIX family)